MDSVRGKNKKGADRRTLGRIGWVPFGIQHTAAALNFSVFRCLLIFPSQGIFHGVTETCNR